MDSSASSSPRPALSTAQWRDVFARMEREAADSANPTNAPPLDATPDAQVSAVLGAFRRRVLQTPDERALALDVPALLRAATPVVGGQRLGNYTLIEPIGRGGMGSVWSARRADGMFEAEVAVKLLGTLALSTSARARFEREGRLLARLVHGNIARLLDAGISDDGQRFLVLEKVSGVEITAHCAGRALADTLAVFRQLLAAVTYAHSQLVLHRDIKPANVLVDASGTVKLLDFGVAKLQGDDTENNEDLTLALGAAVTERYAAPEQFTGAPPSTQTDVFSLGVLLIELVTGQRPEWSASRRSIDASAHIVSAFSGVADDLRAICERATAPEIAQRYRTVSEFDDDLHRFLRCEPVRARRATRSYRLKRFARRHRLALVVAGVTSVAVLSSLMFALVQLNDAREQARISREESNKANAIARFTSGLFTALDPKRAATADRSNLTARDILLAGRERIRTELQTQPEVRLALLGVLAEMFGWMGDEKNFVDLSDERLALAKQLYGEHHASVYHIQTIDVWSDIYGGLFADARKKLTAMDASAGARGEHGAKGDERLADRLHGWAKIIEGEGQATPDAVRAAYERAVRAYEAVGATSSDYSATLVNFGRAVDKLGDTQAALDAMERAVVVLNAARARDPDGTDISSLPQMLKHRAALYAKLGNTAQAAEEYRAAINESNRHAGSDHVQSKLLRAHYAHFLHAQGQREAAWREWTLIEASNATGLDRFGMNSARVLRARMLADEGRWREAFAHAQDAIDAWQRSNDNPTALAEAQQLVDAWRARLSVGQSPSR